MRFRPAALDLGGAGYGHTALLNPSTCASTDMVAYFRTGALPPKGTVCRENLPPFPPPAG